MTALATRGSRVERATVILAFMALFPGFFFYHFLLGTARIRAILGGYFAPVSLLFALPIFFLYVRQIMRERNRLARSELYFGLFLAFFAAVVAVNAANGANTVIVVEHVLGILYLINTFIMFKMIDFDHPEFRYPAMLCLAGMSAAVFAFSIDGRFYLGDLDLAKDPASLATYQGFARSYLVTIVPIIAYTRTLTLRALLYAVGAASLFLNSARSEFAALLFAIPIIEFCFSRQKLLYILVLASFAALVSMNFDLILAQLPDNRILELLDLSQSTSAMARHHLFVQAMQTISTNPIFGDYASYAPGHYAHNVMSAWVDLGIFGFVYLLAILILPGTAMFVSGFFSKPNRSDFVLGFALFCITVLLLATSHYFTDMLIGATLGAYSNYHYRRKYGTQRAPALRPSASKETAPTMRKLRPRPSR
ncbi:MAG: hypothetical protein JWP34_3347 [Massilia sp.]|jgi:hypothetical protein|nr:hypothetical protein [Massilia sp.]